MTRHTRVAAVVTALALAVSLAGWGWFASEQARAGWWTFGQHVAITPDDQGWAHVDTLSVRLTGAEAVASIGEEQAPAGFEFLALDLQVETQPPAEAETDADSGAESDAEADANADADADAPRRLSTCEVQVRDEQGRLFLAGEEVPYEDPYVSSLTCGTSDPDEDPVPRNQSLLVLVPVEAELVSVRVDAMEFPPARFLELPLPR